MFGDTQLNELQMRKTVVLVDCATDRLSLLKEVEKAGAGFARFRSPFGWFLGARSFLSDSGRAEGGWDWGVIAQSALKAYAGYQAVRGFFLKRREKRK